MASVECEPITKVWAGAPGAELLVRGLGNKPLMLKAF